MLYDMHDRDQLTVREYEGQRDLKNSAIAFVWSCPLRIL